MGSAVVGAKVGYPVGGVEGEVVGISDIDGAADGLGLAAIIMIMIDQKEELHVFCEPQSTSNSFFTIVSPTTRYCANHLRTSEGRPDGEVEGISVGTSLGEEDGRREGRCWISAIENDN